MEFKDLEAFVTVADELHFGRAADRLRVSQPPLSNRIQRFEKELGFNLFHRNTRSVELTEAGKLFLPSALEAMQKFRQVLESSASINRGSFGVVRLGFAGASSQSLIPLIGRAVKDTYPDITLQYQSQTYVKTAVEQLKSDQLDLAFTRLPTIPELSSRIVRIESFLCAVPDDHPLASRAGVTVSELTDESFISLRPDQGSILQSTALSICLAAGFYPSIVQYTPDSATALALVAAGLGISITLDSVAETRTDGIVYLPLLEAAPSHMFSTLTWRRDGVSPRLARVLEVSERVLPTPDLSEHRNNPLIKKYLEDQKREDCGGERA